MDEIRPVLKQDRGNGLSRRALVTGGVIAGGAAATRLVRDRRSETQPQTPPAKEVLAGYTTYAPEELAGEQKNGDLSALVSDKRLKPRRREGGKFVESDVPEIVIMRYRLLNGKIVFEMMPEKAEEGRVILEEGIAGFDSFDKEGKIVAVARFSGGRYENSQWGETDDPPWYARVGARKNDAGSLKYFFADPISNELQIDGLKKPVFCSASFGDVLTMEEYGQLTGVNVSKYTAKPPDTIQKSSP